MENEFYNAFATPITMAQNVNSENEMGTMQKPPKLMNIEEYNGWEERFENWVQANHLDAWEYVEQRYVRSIDDDGEIVAIKDLSDDEKKKYKSEKMMISILQQAIKEDILILLQHNGTTHSMWKALKTKFPLDIKKKKDREEWVEKLADALPQDVWGTYLMMLKNNDDFANLSLSKFIEKLEVQEMEQRKMVKMKGFNGEQDIGLYYKGDQDDERLPEDFSWDKYDPNRTSEKVAFVAQNFEDSTTEEEMAYAYYESQQYSPKKKEEEPVSTRKASEKAPIFDHSSDEESKKEKIKERQAAKKKNHKAVTVKEKDDSDDENDLSYSRRDESI
ncbi:uncharacterized protein LOC110875858 [Helianthus annuus]|uniref:uncharacterized protein LOC110875858 n=1 Tax=Helianthus annuus TaxID=4232 RepID=UPI000B8F9F77|nr:uncharacterized protein LOC110875858 [Helianthus annuus]